MVFHCKENEVSAIIVDCDCGCDSQIRFTKWSSDEPKFLISLHTSRWSEEQHGIFWTIKTRLKRAWYSLIGKDYLYTETLIDSQNFRDLVTLLESLDE